MYVDTSALIALVWQRDRDHARVAAHYRTLQTSGDELLTSNLVIAETATRLRYDAGLAAAIRFRSIVEAAVSAGRLAIRNTDAELDQKAWDVMEQYADRSLSFPDCVGAVTAREAGAAAVFGVDLDFTVLGFVLEP